MKPIASVAAAAAALVAVASAPAAPGRADLHVHVAPTLPSTAPRRPLTFLVVVQNRGPDAATHLVVRQLIPVELRLVSVALDGACTRSRPLVCRIARLPAHAFAAITLVLSSTTTGIFATQARVRADQADPHPGDNVDGAAFWIERRRGSG